MLMLIWYIYALSILTVDGHPFVDVDILGRRNNSLKTTFNERGLYKWLAEVEGLGPG